MYNFDGKSKKVESLENTQRTVCFLAFLRQNLEVHQIFGDKVACATVPHTFTYYLKLDSSIDDGSENEDYIIVLV